ncbi:hypothetical protein IEQ34_023429 [Dendrobium chrysotoxum]|uniref:Uncharacterized protein n=1 Tax=Dendrobium chrysotoxum TaxID=161865 RepID=A0AAV7FWG5_DENCH|nr:hypothetical protein IEQ34_023429 [Dendrobium chrysotoxum]
MAMTMGSKAVRRSESERLPQFGLFSLQLGNNEVGIASNRGSACRGEYVTRALYTPPVTPWKWVSPEASDQ